MNKDKLLKNRNYWLNCHDDFLFYAGFAFCCAWAGRLCVGAEFRFAAAFRDKLLPDRPCPH